MFNFTRHYSCSADENQQLSVCSNTAVWFTVGLAACLTGCCRCQMFFSPVAWLQCGSGDSFDTVIPSHSRSMCRSGLFSTLSSKQPLGARAEPLVGDAIAGAIDVFLCGVGRAAIKASFMLLGSRSLPLLGSDIAFLSDVFRNSYVETARAIQ